MAELPVLEFFCGVGGLHCALRRCNVPHTLVCAYDVDDSALRVYRALHSVCSVGLLSDNFYCVCTVLCTSVYEASGHR